MKQLLSFLLIDFVVIAYAGCSKKPDTPLPPKADFNFSIPGAGLLPTVVNFTSTSTNATSYQWYFGDGNTSANPNPSNTYNAAGSFNVKLVVTGTGGKDSITKPVTITLNKPKAAFTFSITDAGNNPTHVSFTNSSTGAATYHWVFDNGDTSSVQNPTDSFFTAKTYNVKLIATNAAGIDSVTTAVTINNMKVTAGFSFAIVNDGQMPCTVNFTNTSSKPATTFQWSFGDGDSSVSAATNPSKTYTFYTITKTFKVKLIASNSTYKDSIEKVITLHPPASTPQINTLRALLITPNNKAFRQDYYDGMVKSITSMQSWYKYQMNGKTFSINTLIIDTITGQHDSAWYASNNGTFSGTDPRYYDWYNTLYEMNRNKYATDFNSGNYVFMVYVAAPGGGSGATGFCIMGEEDLIGLIGKDPGTGGNPPYPPSRWIGGAAHEIGHGFGLAHPADMNYQALMWTGYLTYPNAYLEATDKAILNSSKFFK